MLFLGEGRRRVETGKGLAHVQLLLLPLLLAVNAAAMDCSRCCRRCSRAAQNIFSLRFPMWDLCRGAAAFSGGGQEVNTHMID